MSRPALAGRAVVVCTGNDATALGELVAALAADGCRAAIYLGDPSAPALVEMLAELFESRD